jgi:hypothetical protein
MKNNTESINRELEEATPSMPRFMYYLADYDEEPIITFAPLHVGDVVRVREDDGEMRSRKIAAIEFLEITANAGTGLYNPFVTFEVEGAH